MYILYCIILYMPGRGRARRVRPDAGEQFSLLLIPPSLFPQTFVSALLVDVDVDLLAGVVDNDLCFGIKSLFMSLYVTLSWETPPVGLTAEEQEWNRSSQQ